MKHTVLFLATLTLYLSGCTAVNVQPVSPKNRITHVLIRENPRVPVTDFLDVLVEGFERHGISTKIVPESADFGNAYVVTYVAFQRWDLGTYLADATIGIQMNGRRIASAEYHLRNGGGLSMMKWQSTKAKIDPVLDKLLKDY
ncbi:MAG: hypothetical protein QOD03_179 [Verrucomicrobiota bacterium]